MKTGSNYVHLCNLFAQLICKTKTNNLKTVGGVIHNNEGTLLAATHPPALFTIFPFENPVKN